MLASFSPGDLHRYLACCSSSRWPGLSRFETSKRGNAFGILGMVLAVVATIIAVWAPESWHGSDWATRMPSFIGDAGLASVGLLVLLCWSVR